MVLNTILALTTCCCPFAGVLVQSTAFLLRSKNPGELMNWISHLFSSRPRTCFCASLNTGVRGLRGRRAPALTPPAALVWRCASLDAGLFGPKKYLLFKYCFRSSLALMFRMYVSERGTPLKDSISIQHIKSSAAQCLFRNI